MVSVVQDNMTFKSQLFTTVGSRRVSVNVHHIEPCRWDTTAGDYVEFYFYCIRKDKMNKDQQDWTTEE